MGGRGGLTTLVVPVGQTWAGAGREGEGGRKKGRGRGAKNPGNVCFYDTFGMSSDQGRVGPGFRVRNVIGTEWTLHYSAYLLHLTY